MPDIWPVACYSLLSRVTGYSSNPNGPKDVQKATEMPDPIFYCDIAFLVPRLLLDGYCKQRHEHLMDHHRDTSYDPWQR